MLLFLFLYISHNHQTCDIIIAGGTLASLAAALQSSNQTKVCLIQPTQKIGGQLGDQGVWHIDFNWFYQIQYPDRNVAFNPANLHPFLQKISKNCRNGNCWVSKNCFLYSCISNYINIRNVKIFWNSLIINQTKQNSVIKTLKVVKRYPKQKLDCRPAGQKIKDWYSTKQSQFYKKQILEFNLKGVVIQASQYSDILVISRSFQQGTSNSDICGQSIVYGLHQQYPISNLSLYSNQYIGNGYQQNDQFSLDNFTVQDIWQYRKILGQKDGINEGQVTLQNWNGPGNDYREGYVFNPISKINILQYDANLNFTTLTQAQLRSIRYHKWFQNQSKLPLIATNKYFEGCHGLSILPYIRDGRRSKGYKKFKLEVSDITATYYKNGPLTAKVFNDRIALGFYNIDIHQIKNCEYQKINSNTTLPFFIPLRSLSSQSASNLIVVGRAMAQTFYAASATRTHVTQFHSGVAGMEIAKYIIKKNLSLWQLIDREDDIKQLQTIIRLVMPIQWTINGQVYPKI